MRARWSNTNTNTNTNPNTYTYTYADTMHGQMLAYTKASSNSAPSPDAAVKESSSVISHQ